MHLSKEVLLTSSVSYQSNHICVWDLVSCSPLLQLKEGAIAAAGTLCPVRQEYVYVGVKGKPLLYRWCLSNGQKSKTLVSQTVPGHINAMVISEDGILLAAAIGEKIFLWQCNSGDLIAVLCGKSIKPVDQLMFCEPTFLVSASQDGVITVWNITSIGVMYSSLSQSQPSVQPFFSVSPCACPVRFALVNIVTDILIVVTGQNGHISIYSLYHRRLLDDPRGSLSTDRPILCVLASPVGQLVFCGSSNGVILSTSLSQSHEDYLNLKENNILRERNHPKNFDDAAGDVCCLAMAPSGQALACGTRCGHVVLLTFPDLLPFKKLKLEGPVTNLSVLWRPPWIDDFEKFAPKSCLVHPLEREVGLKSNRVLVRPVGHVRRSFWQSDDNPRTSFLSKKRDEALAESGLKMSVAVSREASTVSDLREETERLKADVQQLRGINRALHQQLVDAILRPGNSEAADKSEKKSCPAVASGKKRTGSASGAPAPKVHFVTPPVNGSSPPSSNASNASDRKTDSTELQPSSSASQPDRLSKKTSKKATDEDRSAPQQRNKPRSARSLLKKNRKKRSHRK